jgi:hypothetical protein
MGAGVVGLELVGTGVVGLGFKGFRLSGLQVGQDGQDAPVVVVGKGQV